MQNNDILPIDFCTICGDKLSDNFKSTRKNHDNIKHNDLQTKIRKTRRQMMIGIPSVLIILGTFLYLLQNNYLDPQFDYLTMYLQDNTLPENYNVLTPEMRKICQDRITGLEQLMYQQKEFTSSNIDELNYLIKNCNVVFQGYTAGIPMFDDVNLLVKSKE